MAVRRHDRLPPTRRPRRRCSTCVGAGARCYVLRFAPVIAGTRRWIVIGGLPAAALGARQAGGRRVRGQDLLRVPAGDRWGCATWRCPGPRSGLLALLIAREPDLGTAACLVPLFLAIAFLAGLRMRAVLGLAAVLLLAGRARLAVRSRTTRSRASTPSSIRSSTRAAPATRRSSRRSRSARAGLVGKGYRQGSQSQLGYLPARHTDFVFSVLAEELGFVGVVVVLGLYLLVLWRALETARLARDRVGAFLVAGVAATFAFPGRVQCRAWSRGSCPSRASRCRS